MPKTLRVLLIEDMEDDELLVLRALRKGGFEPEHLRVDTPEAMAEALRTSRWDVILSDYSMPRFNGLAALKLLQEMNLDIPFIVVSGTIGEDVAVAVMKAGAHDYLLKGALTRLTPAIERELQEAETRRAHREAEQALHASEARFRLVMKHLPVTVAYVNTDQRYEWVYNLHHDFSAHQVIGKRANEYFPVREALQIMDMERGVLESGVGARGEISVTLSDGIHHFDVIAEPVRDDAGTLIGVTSLFIDIAERKRADKEKESLQSQLLQSQKLEAIGELAGGMAHDFNNMLTVIMGNANLALLNMKPEDPGVLEFKEIMAASERARDLTMKLLSFSRREKLNVRAADIADVVRIVTGMLERSISKKIDIHVIRKHDHCLSHIDVNQIAQALLNICNNACDAMGNKGTLTIEIAQVRIDADYCRTHLEGQPGPFCLIQISDTGMGMHEDMLTKIFEPFFTTKGVGKGTGLGLAVSHGIIKSHGGHIRVYSELGKGSVFKIFLPLAESATIDPEECAPAEILAGTETILVVDDEAHILKLAERVLSQMGYKILTAGSGEQAIDIYNRLHEEISLVILDLIMPGIDGRDVFHTIQKINPRVKAILSSGYSMNGHAGALLSEGVRAFVQKPYRIDQLCTIVRHVLDAE